MSVQSGLVVIRSVCDKEGLSCVFKLQKRAARIISDANNQASSVKLFSQHEHRKQNIE